MMIWHALQMSSLSKQTRHDFPEQFEQTLTAPRSQEEHLLTSARSDLRLGGRFCPLPSGAAAESIFMQFGLAHL